MHLHADIQAESKGPPALLAITNVSKSFGGTHALREVGLSLFHGEVLALLGENGAGKSTLIKILAGVHRADRGTVSFEGHDVTKSLASVPIAFIHQDLGLIEWMTVAENICMTAGFPRKGAVHGPISWKRARTFVTQALGKLGVDIDPDLRVNQLGRTEKSLVAIARALTADVRIVVMDEPTASLPADEVVRLFSAVRALRRDGVGVIYVSHRLEEIFEIADRVAVLRDGRSVGEVHVKDTTPEQLVRLIIGKELNSAARRPGNVSEQYAVELANVTSGGVGPISFTVRPREILALTGLRGAGQERIGRALFGLEPISNGRLTLDGEAITLSSPSQALGKGIRFASGDRIGESIVQGFSIAENFFLNPTNAGSRWYHRLKHKIESRAALELGRYVQLFPNNPNARIESLSGGNQQKVVIGRCLNLEGKLLILEDPTAGVDIGAKHEIYRLLFQALGSGLAIVLISTDFVEVATIADRAVVFSRGKLVAEISGERLTAANLLSASALNAAEAA